MECEHCKKTFSTKSSLKVHKTTAKYCLRLQGREILKGYYICEICGKDFNVKFHLQNHILICQKNNHVLTKYKVENQTLKEENNILKKEILILNQHLEKYRKYYKELSLTAMKRPVNNTKKYSDK